MLAVERLVDRVWCLGCDFDDGVFRSSAVQFNFLLWDHTATGVDMGCFECDDDVWIVMKYESHNDGTLRVLRGQAWTSDSLRAEDRRKADMGTAVRFLGAMPQQFSVSVVFDGQMEVDRKFDLHLHFDHPIQGRRLLLRKVLEGDNPLTVIDQFM